MATAKPSGGLVPTVKRRSCREVFGRVVVVALVESACVTYAWYESGQA